jgi:hypothetical protein
MPHNRSAPRQSKAQHLGENAKNPDKKSSSKQAKMVNDDQGSRPIRD